MTYEIVDFDSGDILGVYESLNVALQDARALIKEFPQLQGDIGIVLDDLVRANNLLNGVWEKLAETSL